MHITFLAVLHYLFGTGCSPGLDIHVGVVYHLCFIYVADFQRFSGFSLFTIVALVIVGICVAFTLSVILVLLFGTNHLPHLSLSFN